MTPLEAARRLSQRICAAADWRDDRCTWPDAERGGPMDASLYDGAAGVAWFLSKLVAVAGQDGAWRPTAVAAIRYALDLVAARPTARAGLYGGDLGVLWAAAEVGGELGDRELVERALELAADASSPSGPVDRAGFDLLGGSAGDLLARVGLAGRTGGPGLRDAERLGAGLAGAAEEMLYGVAWPQPSQPGGRPAYPVGMAHGASGIALALLELDAAAGAGRFRRVALEALAFERAWFDRRACAWRDPQAHVPTSTSWCRGSAGIGLARLRCLRLVPDGRLGAEAGAALASVHASTAGALGPGPPAQQWEQRNFSVCHGLMGAADLLVHASVVLEVAEHRVAAERIVEHGLATAAAEGGWPCGTVDRAESMGLMLGLAGIGTVLLRVAAPDRLPPVGLLSYSMSA
jgi:lantibiotic biosynthesis protein